MGWAKHGKGQTNDARPMPTPGYPFAFGTGEADSQAEAHPNDVFIVVMGPTGSGKTSFINLCSGTISLEVGHGLRSCTESIAEVTFHHNGFRVHLIDTPGFDDTLIRTSHFDNTSRLDSEVLKEVACYLATTYKFHMRIDGLIYITPITMRRFTPSARKNLRMFSNLVGEKSLSKVVLATSMWDLMPQMQTWQQAEATERTLMGNFWGVLIDKGSTVYRLDGHKDSALRVVNSLLPSEGDDGEILQIQREIVDELKTLDETKAGKELAEEFRRLQESIQKEPKALELEVKGATAKNLVRHLLLKEDHLKLQISQIEDERNGLHIDFRRLAQDRNGKTASLTRQIEIEREDQARHLEWVSSEIIRLRSEIEIQSSAVKGSTRKQPWNPAGPTEPKVKQLEEELAKCHRDIAEKDARMEDLRSFMIYQLKGAVAGPPSPYSQTATPINRLTMEPIKQSLIEDSDTSQSTSKEDTQKATGLKSPLARKQNRSYKSAPAKRISSDAAGQVASRHHRANQRPAYDDRIQIRRELYQHSLHSLVDYTRTCLSRESISQLAVLAQDSTRDRFTEHDVHSMTEVFRDRVKLEMRSSEQSTETAKDWLYSKFSLCRDIALIVYANCRRLQSTGLAGEYFSSLALLPPSQSRQSVVTMKWVVIKEVQSLFEVLNVCIHRIHQMQGPLDASGLGNLWDPISQVQKLCQEILVVVGLYNCMTKLTEEQLQQASKPLLKEAFEGQADGLATIFCEWQCVLQVLDLGVLAYAGAHVSDIYENISANEVENIQVPEPSLLLPGTHNLAQAAKRIQCRRLRLKCLSSFLEDREVWVFDDTMGHSLPPLYLVADIDIFADVWGPVWKVADLEHPGRVVKYNVGGGSILPWRFDAKVHPKLKANERLCHWRSNADYIRGNGPSSPNLSSSSSTTSSDTEETPADEPAPESFTGLEILVIGADQSPRLQWKPCRCPVDSLKLHLRNAGRLDEIIASKSFRYVDTQQNNLVLGSHGFQAGYSRTLKDKREEPLKKSLLDRWENEADSRDPRRLENLWGVAVSLCTMNAQRVRLVELLAEESVVALLRFFPWSDLNHNGTSSKIRERYLNAVHSDDPLALGDLWDRHPSWREELGNAILVCLRILFRTGYHKDRDEFHMLWLPPRCRTPRRVTLKPADQSWVSFLKDTTDSVTVAVVVEDSLGSQTRCSGNRPGWFRTPSILETAICINSTLDPTPKMIRTQGCQDENHYITRKDFEDWQSTWDVSALGPGDHLWMSSQTRVRTIWPLTKWHLLLEMDTVKRLILREMIGMKPSERIGHREYTDEELDGDDVRPIPVHITS